MAAPAGAMPRPVARPARRPLIRHGSAVPPSPQREGCVAPYIIIYKSQTDYHAPVYVSIHLHQYYAFITKRSDRLTAEEASCIIWL